MISATFAVPGGQAAPELAAFTIRNGVPLYPSRLQRRPEGVGLKITNFPLVYSADSYLVWFTGN
jgi:hypothetical protein